MSTASKANSRAQSLKSGRALVQERALQTRELIINGAASAFDTKGFSASSLKDISQLSGVSLGSIYFHFNGKDQIAHAVISEQHERSYKLILNELDKPNDPVEQLIDISIGVTRQLLVDKVVRAGFRLGMDEAALQDAAAIFYERWAEGAGTLVGWAQSNGIISQELPSSTIGRLLIGFFTGTQLMSQATSERNDLVDAVESMWVLLIRSLVNEPEQARLIAYVKTASSSTDYGVR